MKKTGHHFDLSLFFNMSKQFLVPGGLSAECGQVSVSQLHARELALRPQSLGSSKCSNLGFGCVSVTVVIGTNLIFLVFE